MQSTPSVTTTSASRSTRGPRGLVLVWAGTVERNHPRKGTETLRYATFRDCSRYPAPVLKDLAKRLPRRLRAA